MAYRKSYPKRRFYKKRRFYPKRVPRTAFTSNKSTMVKLTAVIAVQASQLKYAPLVLSTHAPVYWRIL